MYCLDRIRRDRVYASRGGLLSEVAIYANDVKVGAMVRAGSPSRSDRGRRLIVRRRTSPDRPGVRPLSVSPQTASADQQWRRVEDKIDRRVEGLLFSRRIGRRFFPEIKLSKPLVERWFELVGFELGANPDLMVESRPASL